MSASDLPAHNAEMTTMQLCRHCSTFAMRSGYMTHALCEVVHACMLACSQSHAIMDGLDFNATVTWALVLTPDLLDGVSMVTLWAGGL